MSVINPYAPSSYEYFIIGSHTQALDNPRRVRVSDNWWDMAKQADKNTKLTKEEIHHLVYRNKNINISDLLKSMPTEWLYDKSLMAELIELNARVYAYTPPELKTFEFDKNALRLNPSVFNQLPISQQEKPEYIKAYIDGMNSNMVIRKLDHEIEAMQYKYKFSQDLDLEQAFPDEMYCTAYEDMLAFTAHTFDDVSEAYTSTLNELFATVSTIRMLRPELRDHYYELDLEILRNSKPQLANMIVAANSGHELSRELIEGLLQIDPQEEVLQMKYEKMREFLIELYDRSKDFMIEQNIPFASDYHTDVTITND